MLTRPPFAASTQHPTLQRSTSLGLTVDTHDTHNTQAHGANRALQRLSNVRSASEHHLPDNITQARNTSIVELPTDFDVDLEEVRPAKRTRLDSDLDIVASPQAVVQDALHETIPGVALGLPMRPTESHKRHGSRRYAGEQAARKADGIIPPAMATKLVHPRAVADFVPWRGNHPEDILNEQTVKTGYTEGPSPNQNESNTARLTIWPTLSQKNNVALHTLSLLYTQVLEKRQALGRCTAPSSFKPPPRVTVTDTKREAWLRDLANPSVPLRRQSRTIPHGIRGKLLLDQCVTKAIPLQRAVWLAKCVGANELRAFKRKGVSGTAAAQGESKWVRDWTISVEQFMSDTINASDQQGWRAKIEYSVKLVTTIYTENLIEKDHFLDWTVASFSTASLDQVPSWMILTQLYWQDLVSFSRRGRLLAKALLTHLDTVSRRGHAVYHLLKSHLEKQLALMLTNVQECLILPDVWQNRRHLLKAIAQDKQAFGVLDRRNLRLLEPTTRPLQAFCHPYEYGYTMS
ncbi:hypothetical protein AMS68_004743 [Peltaster fructicola]|uniref:Mediator of RNA polymerase II transcription subunit 12 n=1 Tax=Peltaster fructicola TaxID=286661 RepID=A0A6H0XX18_9PEZI|nr:hypothetical protein AMS68_004743 [Peltaster fructicola]